MKLLFGFVVRLRLESWLGGSVRVRVRVRVTVTERSSDISGRAGDAIRHNGRPYADISGRTGDAGLYRVAWDAVWGDCLGSVQ